MQEHPVPQNITAYEFHLIGSMTIKQFLILLAGGGLGVLVYGTNLPSIIRWPLIILFVVSGVAMAFVPYEERTLDQWFINFIRAIYRPTKYYWRRTQKSPSFFDFSPKSSTQMLYQPDTSPMRRTRVQEYLSSLNQQEVAAAVDPLDIFQSDRANVNDLFSQVNAAANVLPGADSAQGKPVLQVRTRPLGRTVLYSSNVPITDNAMPSAPLVTITSQDDDLDKAAPEPSAPAPQEARIENIPLVSLPITSTDAASPRENTAAPLEASQAAATAESYIAAAPAAPLDLSQVRPAIFRTDLPFPSLPTQPNLLIGMVHDRNGGIVSNAIVEILDESGNTVRAMKTNALGQFYISAPLRAGRYTLETEKEGHTFPVYGFEATDIVLAPIDIQAAA